MLSRSLEAHTYLFIAISIVLLIFLIYVYLSEHKRDIKENKVFRKVFSDLGLDSNMVTHDDSVWFYKGFPTCVGYGDPEDDCPYFENFCAGDNFSFGSYKQQAEAIKEAVLEGGGEHPSCPLIYPGAP